MSKKTKITIAIISLILIFVNGALVIKLSMEDRNMNIPAAENNTGDKLQTETVPGIRVTCAEGFYYEPLSEEIKVKISGKSFKYRIQRRKIYTDPSNKEILGGKQYAANNHLR